MTRCGCFSGGIWRRKSLAPLTALVVLLGLATGDQPQARATPTFQPTFQEVPCPSDVTADNQSEVTCGFLTVLEDRSNPTGRTIRIFVARVEPKVGASAADVNFWVGANFSLVPSREELGTRAGRMSINWDARGLGHSKPTLGCPEVEPDSKVVQGTAAGRADFLDAVQACHDRLTAKGIDVGSYNLEEMAADAEDLRIALGIDQWNLITLGTTSSISYEIMRRYPSHIRSVVFDSPDAPQFDLLTEAVRDTRYAIRHVSDACAADPTCHRWYPTVRRATNQALRRLRQHPSRFIDEGIRVVVDDADAVSRMRNWVTWDSPAAFPRNIYSLRNYGFDIRREPGREADSSVDPPFYQGHMLYFDLKTIGTFYSVVCHDEVPFVDRSALEEAAGDRPWYVDAYVHSPYFKACERWDAGVAETDPLSPVVSDIPTLFLQPGLDMWSSLPLTKIAAASLSRSWIVLFPTWAHNVLGSDCGIAIRNAWIVDPTSPPADTTCVGDMAPIDWAKPVRPRVGVP